MCIILGAVPIATLSIRDLRLRGSSFIRSHASKHGLPNASRKLMKEVIELLKSHYAVVHQVTMVCITKKILLFLRKEIFPNKFLFSILFVYWDFLVNLISSSRQLHTTACNAFT